MRKIIGITGPSSFTSEVIKLVECHLKSNFVMLYHDDTENLNDWLEHVHGVIVGGGVDIHPSVYGNQIRNHSGFSKFDIKRDRRELFIIEKCIEKKIPMLGICRGHQLLGIYHGIELIQDIGDGDISHSVHKHNIHVNEDEPVHYVKLIGDKTKEYFNKLEPEERKRLSKTSKFSQEYIWVNSYHHQALKYINEKDKRVNWNNDAIMVGGIAQTGIKNCEEIIELLIGKNAPWLSTQWHPEIDYKYNTPSSRVIDRFNEYMK